MSLSDHTAAIIPSKDSTFSSDSNDSTSTLNDAQLKLHADKIHQLENSLASPLQFKGQSTVAHNLLDRMKSYNVPAVSMALIDNGEIAWVKSWGVKDADTLAPVTPNTLFQAASISKPVSALAALRMVESGELSLDKPINNYLTRWQLPENEFTQQVPVTLTHLLSHTGGLTVHGFRGYAQTDEQPTAIQVLNGEAIAKSDPVVVDTLPGSHFRYSGGGSTVFQIAMEDVTHKSFTQLMDELVLKPAGMDRSTFAQPLPESFQTDVASGHLAEGNVVSGKWHNYPIQSPASLWTTPTDLANFALAIIKAFHAEEGQSAAGNILSKSMCDLCLTEQKNAWGLGPRLFMDNGKTIGFHHGGANEGYRCEFVAFLDGRGAAVMTNSDVGDALLGEIMAAAAEVYDWPTRKAKVKEWLPLTAADKQQFVGVYTFKDEDTVYRINVALNGEAMDISSTFSPVTDAFYITERKDNAVTFTGGSGMSVDFSLNEKGQPFIATMGVVFTQNAANEPK